MPFFYDPIKYVEKYDPFYNALETPGINSPDEYPTRCLKISEKLIPYLLGLVDRGTWIDAWKGTPDEINQAVGVFKDLQVVLTEGNANCSDCSPPESCVTYYPHHPNFEFSPGAINGPTDTPPAGYLQHPWFTGDKLTIPGFTLKATDVLCNLASVASSGLGLIEQITVSGLPRLRFSFESGVGKAQIHLLNVEFGGIAIVRVDESQTVETVNLQSIGLGDFVPSTEWILTLLGLVTNGINGTTIIEIDIPTAGAHTIDILMSPYVEFPNVLATGWGGGIRKIVICGEEVSCEDQICPECPSEEEDCGCCDDEMPSSDCGCCDDETPTPVDDCGCCDE